MMLLALFVAPPPLLAVLARLSPDTVVCVAAVGLCCIFLELNRPGSILPGALGLLLLLLAAAALAPHALQPWAVGLLAVGVLILFANLRTVVSPILLGLGIVCGIAGLRFLIAGSPAAGAGAYVHLPAALFGGGATGVLAAVLSRIALRARRAKAVH